MGIVTALAPEARALTRKALQPRRVIALGDGHVLWLSGMGQDAARQAANGLADAGATALAVFGVAGALAPGMRSGALFCPACVIDERGRDYLPAPAWRASLGRRLLAAGLPVLMDGSLLSLPTPLLTSHDKAAMRERHLSAAVDMESAAVAAVASERRLPFVVLRAIVDERDDEIPGELQTGIDSWGRVQPLPLLTALLRHPRLLAQLPGLAARMRKATRALRLAAGAAGHDLGRECAQPC